MVQINIEQHGDNYRVGIGSINYMTITHQSQAVKGIYPIIVYDFTKDGTLVRVEDLTNNQDNIAEVKRQVARNLADKLAKQMDGEVIDTTINRTLANSTG